MTLYLPTRASVLITSSNTDCTADTECRVNTVFLMLVCHGAPGLRMDWAEEDQRQGNVISVPPEVYTKGCVQDVDDGLAVSIFSKVIIIISTLLLLFPPKLFPSSKHLLPSDIFCGVCLQGAEIIGYPVVIKASEGGGGKGIRKVESSEDFPSFFRQVCVITFIGLMLDFFVI